MFEGTREVVVLLAEGFVYFPVVVRPEQTRGVLNGRVNLTEALVVRR